MIRRKYGVSLARTAVVEEDVDPNSSIVNIADCMLVLLLGVIVALIAYYNIDLTQTQEPEDQIVGIEVNLDQNQDGAIDDNYKRQGTVYYDEQTNTYYFVNGEGA